MSDYIKTWIDWAAVGTAITTVAGWLPPLAALFSIAWLGWQMYDRLRYGPRRKP
ncbi:MAG: hypothetical protein Q8Q14_01500 [Gemmatimonadales bacterium]|nr:hypothetical protein [Gemmatimonadales bacterium]